MEEYFDILRLCPLFSGISNAELMQLLHCLSAVRRHYAKNEYIWMTGDTVTSIGIVLSGAVHVIQEDFWGNRAILAGFEAGEMFGEAFSCAEIKFLPVGVLAVQSSEILLLDYRRILTTCTAACVFHVGLVRNMTRILANKNVMLTHKMEILTRRTTRDKLLAYLSTRAQQAGASTFSIPFNRQELAEYLSVDRSALSSELSRMQRDGILHYHRNSFVLCERDGE